MVNKTNRREFLKYSLLFSANTCFLIGKYNPKFSFQKKQEENPSKIGRILFDDIHSYALPDTESEILNTYSMNDLVEYQQEISTIRKPPYSEIWCQLADQGYIQYKNLQPVANKLNEPVMEISTSGQLAEVTVPFTTAYVNQWNEYQKETSDQMLFYGSTHWVYDLGQRVGTNEYYYLIKEDRWGDSFYVDATHMRMVSDEELGPVSNIANGSEKVIRIYLQEQYLVAYEGEEAVFMSVLSSGQLSGNTDLTTPTGSFFINYKRSSRHMVHSERFGINDNELYGVPWISYFTDTGIAFHGTYWHNDFSKPNSHGCINLPIPAARWIYLWSLPVVPPRAKKYVSKQGTRVEVY